MIEIDFLPVEATDGPGSKSGDAICIRFASVHDARPFVVVIDGGYKRIGARIAHHVRTMYSTETIDLVVSTHPDQDHLNGLIPLLEEMQVGELMLHLPWQHRQDVSDYSNIDNIRALYLLAVEKGIPVTEPFRGVNRFDGRFRVLGPSEDFYEELLFNEKGEERAALMAAAMSSTAVSFSAAAPEVEPLDDVDTTSARNNTSVVCLIEESDELHLFTGDAGITALDHSVDAFEGLGRSFANERIEFFQVPHHGSRRNLGPAVLDRLFPNGGSTAFISSALADEKHPGEAVLQALQDRWFDTYATEGKHLLHHHEGQPRVGYRPAPPR